MNEHEIERIAAAINQLRPDWPIASLRTTLGHPQLKDRPRRDVVVALGWIACEANTATPKRVLEAGPWWKAAAVDGTTTSNRDNPPAHERCSVCSLSRERCGRVRFADDDHEFEPATVDHKRPAAAMADIVREAKGRLEPTAPPPEPRTHQPDPRADVAREAIHQEDA